MNSKNEMYLHLFELTQTHTAHCLVRCGFLSRQNCCRSPSLPLKDFKETSVPLRHERSEGHSATSLHHLTEKKKKCLHSWKHSWNLCYTVCTVFSILTADFISPCFVGQNVDKPHPFLSISVMISLLLLGFKTWADEARKTSNVSNWTPLNSIVS